MAELIKENYGREYTEGQIKRYYANHHLNSGLTGYFEKGHQPANKGKKVSPEVYEKIKRTMIKPGNRPPKTANVGDIVKATVGYYKIKVAEPNVWEWCHVRAWQQAYGEIPEGMMVSFKDGNKANWELENLMLVSKEENIVLNNMHLRFDRAEMTESGLLVAKLMCAAKERRKKRSE